MVAAGDITPEDDEKRESREVRQQGGEEDEDRVQRGGEKHERRYEE
jgi:hypothetical protein